MNSDPTASNADYNNEECYDATNDLKMHRMFNGCRDEHGFVLSHISIVARTNHQLKAIKDMHAGLIAKNRTDFNAGLSNLVDVLDEMN